MKFPIFILALFILPLFQVSAQNARQIEGQYIVEFKESVAEPVVRRAEPAKRRKSKEEVNRSARNQVLSTVANARKRLNIDEKTVLFEYADAIAGFSAKLTEQERARLEADPEIKGVYPDFEINIGPSNLKTNQDQMYIENQADLGCSINAAGGSVDGSNKNTWIWVLDTGVDPSHPDLNVLSFSFKTRTGESVRGRPLSFGRSFVQGENITTDLNGHGTHVAGIAAAKDNGIGVVGVSAGATVIPIKVFGESGSGSFSAVVAGLDHVARHNIANDVVNMSLGAYGINNCENFYPALNDAISNLTATGTYVVMAAGNDSGNANTQLPGCINGDKVFTVGAMDCDQSCAGYSNWGSSVDWAAVGSNVTSTYPGGLYATGSGTSQAAPVVAGIIHARGGAPVSGGTVGCDGNNYQIAKRQ